MNSSVTWDSDTSVMSSLCLEISPSSRSNGPSKTSRCTSNAFAPRGASSPAPASAVIVPPAVLPTLRRYRVPVLVLALLAGADPPGDQAVGAARVQVGQQDGDRLPDQAAAVQDEPEAAQLEPRVLQVKQLGGRQVDGDLLIVSFPAGRLAFINV